MSPLFDPSLSAMRMFAVHIVMHHPVSSTVRLVRYSKDHFCDQWRKQFLWMEDSYGKSLPVTSKCIMRKALAVHTALMEKSDIQDKEKAVVFGKLWLVTEFCEVV